MIPIEVLSQACGLAFDSWGLHSWYRAAPATSRSIERIERRLGVRLPRAFVQLSQMCPGYGGWFASIGEDYRGPVHILSLNHAFRTPDDPADYSEGTPHSALPEHLTLINHGHDGDCDCWDTRRKSPEGEHPIIYFSLSAPHFVHPTYRFTSFHGYVEHLCRARAEGAGAQAAKLREMLAAYPASST